MSYEVRELMSIDLDAALSEEDLSTMKKWLAQGMSVAPCR